MISNTNGGKLLRRSSTSYKKLLAELHLELLILLRLNPGAQGEHLTSLRSWIAVLLLVTRVWPVYLVDELVVGVL